MSAAVIKSQQTPAIDLANQNGVRFPDESGEYREARDALLAEEIEPRRHIERVAEQRRALPPGGSVPKDCVLVGENGPVKFSELFGDKQALAPYNCMYGPKREGAANDALRGPSRNFAAGCRSVVVQLPCSWRFVARRHLQP